MTDFKVGDTVRLTGGAWGKAFYEIAGVGWGTTHKIVGPVKGGKGYMILDNKGQRWGVQDDGYPFAAELVEDVVNTQEFLEVGEFSPEEESNPISPSHYQGFSNGAEVIDITEHLTPNLANVVKYAARAGSKTPDPMEDLLKAQAYLNREINRLKGDPKW